MLHEVAQEEVKTRPSRKKRGMMDSDQRKCHQMARRSDRNMTSADSARHLAATQSHTRRLAL